MRARRLVGLAATFASALLLAQPAIAQTPYGGTASAIPGGIEAEHFDNGGSGVAYKDNTPGNFGVGYRSTDVDIGTTLTGGYTVGWIGAGEWLRYTVNVGSSGNYRIVARVASAGTGGTFHIEFNGQDKTGPLSVADTGGWNSYRDLPVVVSLSAGVQSMRIVFDSNGPSTGAVGNLSYLSFTKTTETVSGSTTTSSGSGTAASFGGTPWAIPGGIQTEDFDTGGQGVSYYDNSSGNSGGVYRNTDVDISTTSAGGYAVGWTSAGEWLKYSVNVASTGTYRVVTRVASSGSGGKFHIEFNGVDKTGGLWIPNTGGWNNYQDLVATVSLSAGVQTMRIVFDANGSTGAVGNLSFISFTQSTTSTSTSTSTSSGGGKLRVMAWNIHFGHGNLDGQAQLMASSGAHVILLQEASTWDGDMPNSLPAKLKSLTGYTWTSVFAPHIGSSGEGTLILTRLPVLSKTTLQAYNRGFARVLVEVGGVAVNLFSVHLEYYDTSLRTSQLDRFMSWARGFGGPRIAGGDFNSWWGESWIKKMETEYHDVWQYVTGSDENGYTLNGSVRFDYQFRSFTDASRVTPTACWVQSTSLSDHRPVLAEYTVR
ncbi:MAG TPA: carbohydrate-binding protein [Vicinamibacterales bacterium]|nr:carbohydrate-binding protein [Vicinamibacterales bacterium]